MNWNLVLLLFMLAIVFFAMVYFLNRLFDNVADFFKGFKQGFKNGFPPK